MLSGMGKQAKALPSQRAKKEKAGCSWTGDRAQGDSHFPLHLHLHIQHMGPHRDRHADSCIGTHRTETQICMCTYINTYILQKLTHINKTQTYRFKHTEKFNIDTGAHVYKDTQNAH